MKRTGAWLAIRALEELGVRFTFGIPGVQNTEVGAKLAHPGRAVNAIVGDGAFAMTCMKLLTASRNALGIVYYVFHDGALSQIAQFQQLPYSRRTFTEIGAFNVEGVAIATGAAQRNAGTFCSNIRAVPDYASLHPGYTREQLAGAGLQGA